MQGEIIENVNNKRNFIPGSQIDEESALYQKKYKFTDDLPQPKINHVDMEVDLFPEI